MKKEAPLFKTEAELCAAFIAWAKPKGWTIYAETAGWDLLLVGSGGIQLGVQAKLALNMKVLEQTIENHYAYNGPDYRAVLVGREASSRIVRALGFGMFAPVDEKAYQWRRLDGDNPPTLSFHQQLPIHDRDLNYTDSGRVGRNCEDWFDWCPKERHELPSHIPDVVAGVPGPVQLTKWKIAAMRVAIHLELFGAVSIEEFRIIGIDRRLWIDKGWVKHTDRRGIFQPGLVPDFAKQHPTVYAEIRAEVVKENEGKF